MVDYCPKKEDTYHTCLTMGGNLFIYPGNVGTTTSDMLTAKLLFNSILSTPYSKFMGIDIKQFYLNTTMAQ